VIEMKKGTKEQIYEYLCRKTQVFDLTHPEDFTTTAIAEALYLSRSAASQYLNELAADQKIVKVKTRPVYFFSARELERQYGVTLPSEFTDLDELVELLRNHGDLYGGYSDLVGYDGSLSTIISRSVEIFEYPPQGIPLILYGDEGTGRRTLARLICRNSLTRGGVLSGKSRIESLELAADNEPFRKKLKQILNDNQTATAVIVSNLDLIDQTTDDYLSSLLEQNKDRGAAAVHFIFISHDNPARFLSSGMLRNLPTQVKLKRFDQRPLEEREALVVEMFCQEEQRLNKTIEISSNVVRTLENSKFSDNIQGLKRVVQLMCARSVHRMGNQTEGRIRIHSYDMPAEQLEAIQVTGEDISYIDCAHYHGSAHANVYLEFLDEMLNCCQAKDVRQLNERFNDVYHDIVNRPMVRQSEDSAALRGIEAALANIVNTTVQNRYINIPGNFTYLFAKLVYAYQQNAATFSRWENEHRAEIERSYDWLEREFVTEAILAEEMSTMVERNLEFSLPPAIRLFMTLVLHRYNGELSDRKIFGVIICHGYSTASSIASAVNALIDSYVFDSIDMPIKTTVAEIETKLKDKVGRINRFADIVIMVDMGSLEQLGSSLTDVTNKNIAVINNVTTKMALDIGYQIVRGASLDTIFENATEKYRVEYKIIHNQVKDVIMFSSESGVNTEQRMMDLFRHSLPIDVPVQYKLASLNRVNPLDQGENILFVIGTEDPHFDSIPYIPLEDIITTGSLDMAKRKLQPYLNDEQLQQLIVNIRSNFTLTNVVQYLTILNPKTVLDYITVAVDILQKRYNVELEGKRLVGIYIHICCMVERLVTKVGTVPDTAETVRFAREHADFVKDVNESMLPIMNHYHITVPEAEMMYLYSFFNPNNNRPEGGDEL
jgi:sigma-54 dependent transcriptional regulator of gfr operon